MSITILIALGLFSTVTLASSSTVCEPTRDDTLGPFYKPDTTENNKICQHYANFTNLQKIMMSGYVRNANCELLTNAKLEIWQTDDHGEYYNSDNTCRGFVLTDSNGFYQFETIHPGRYLFSDSDQYRPSHIHLYVTKQGYGSLATQIYFQGDPYLAPNDGCPQNICHSDDLKRTIGLSTYGSTTDLEGSFDIVISSSALVNISPRFVTYLLWSVSLYTLTFVVS